MKLSLRNTPDNRH